MASSAPLPPPHAATARKAPKSPSGSRFGRGAEATAHCHRYVIFQGAATSRLQAAFAARPHWRDAVEDEAKGGDHNARCRQAVQRGQVRFCWRHLAPPVSDAHTAIVNRWPGSHTLTAKDEMLATLSRYCERHALELCALVPLSFELRPRGECPGLEPGPPTGWAAFAAAFAAVASGGEPRVPADHGRALWLVKPARGARGEGIRA
jgi:hypothetical protein